MTRVLDIADPARREQAGEFQGRLPRRQRLGHRGESSLCNTPPSRPRLSRSVSSLAVDLEAGSVAPVRAAYVLRARGVGKHLGKQPLLHEHSEFVAGVGEVSVLGGDALRGRAGPAVAALRSRVVCTKYRERPSPATQRSSVPDVYSTVRSFEGQE